MSFIGSNIKKIRSIKKLSQSAFAELFGLTRASIGAYEEGRAEPKIDAVQNIANYFGLTLDQLLAKELTVNELYHFDIFKDEFTTPTLQKGKKSTPAASVPALNETRIPFVSAEQQQQYIASADNKSFVNGLPALMLPLQLDTPIRAFQHNDHAMQYADQGIFQGDLVVGKEASLKGLNADAVGHLYTFVTKNSIVTRRLQGTGKTLTLATDNANSKNEKLSSSDVVEVWEVTGVFSQQMKRPSSLEERLARLENK